MASKKSHSCTSTAFRLSFSCVCWCSLPQKTSHPIIPAPPPPAATQRRVTLKLTSRDRKSPIMKELMFPQKKELNQILKKPVRWSPKSLRFRTARRTAQRPTSQSPPAPLGPRINQTLTPRMMREKWQMRANRRRNRRGVSRNQLLLELPAE